MRSWWDLGEGCGQLGDKLALYQITCPFCFEKGNFALEFHAEKQKPNSRKKINFDTYKCGSCAGYVQVTWSVQEHPGSRCLHDYVVIPWPKGKLDAPEEWPETVGRFWVQAHDNETNENWDAAALMARSALQAALRAQEVNANSLKEEIDILADNGVLPNIMKEWAHEVRLLGNISAHPPEDKKSPQKKDVQDIINFLDYLLKYLYDLPKKIEEYRKRAVAK